MCLCQAVDAELCGLLTEQEKHLENEKNGKGANDCSEVAQASSKHVTHTHAGER